MTNTDKIMILGDLHFGTNSNSKLFQDIQKEAFSNFIIPTIRDKNINLVFLTGDVFNSRESINIQTLNHAFDIFEMLEKEGCKIEIVAGNHDAYYNNTYSTTALRMFDRWDCVTYYTDITVREINNKTVMMVPYLQTAESVKEFKKQIKKTKPGVCIGHFEINKFYMTATREEKNGLSQKLFKDNTDKLISGHFHIRDKKGNIVYVGTPYQLNWNDYGNTKGVHILNVDNLRVQYYENEISPTFVKINYDTVEKTDDKKDIENKVKDNFVKIIIERKISQQNMQDTLNMLSSMNPKSLTPVYSGDFIKKQTTEIDQETLSSSHSDLLHEYIDKSDIPEGLDKDEMKNVLDGLYEDVK